MAPLGLDLVIVTFVFPGATAVPNTPHKSECAE